jgi:hypothetical protein
MRDIQEWTNVSRGKPLEKRSIEDWEYEAQIGLHYLFLSLSNSDEEKPPPKSWPHWNQRDESPFSPGFHHEDIFTPLSRIAANLWLCEHASSLFSEVARVIDKRGLRQNLEPTRLAQKLIEILRDQSMGMPSALRLELLARFMVSVGIDIVPADANWNELLRHFAKQKACQFPYPNLRPLLRWAVELELAPEKSTLDDRRQSYSKFMRQTDNEWSPTQLNATAYTLQELEIWRPATPIIEHSIALDSSSDAALDTYGWALFFEGDYEGAERELKKSLCAKELHPRVHPKSIKAQFAPEMAHSDWCIVQYHRFQVALWSHRLSDARSILDEMQAKATRHHLTIQATKLKTLFSEANPLKTNPNQAGFEYDVALSFAGEDRWYADRIARSLVERGIRVFYDDFERAALWGEDLYQYLSTVYQHRANFCVVFISAQYARKRWPTLECRAAQARAFQENSPCLLPVRIDDTEIPGIFPTLGYMSWQKDGVELIVQTLIQKLRGKNAG